LLAAAGYEIHAISAHAHAGPDEARVSWHCCDLLDPVACAKVVATIAPTHLLHLAWIATPGQFWSNAANLHWLANGVALIDEFYRRGGKRAVGVGTCAEYAWNVADSNEDSSALKPDTIYGRCKLALGIAFEAAAEVHAGSAAWARLFFPYGPGEPAERLIPAVIRGLLRNEPVDCTHGGQVRDFIFVDDVATALTALLDSPARGAFNVGSGIAMTLREVVAIITAQLGRPELVRFGARQPPAGDPARVVADIGKLKRETGWRPSIGVTTGIERTIASWRERLGNGAIECR
jgi:nucleoside-diphosphate-sugar epimerase